MLMLLFLKHFYKKPESTKEWFLVLCLDIKIPAGTVPKKDRSLQQNAVLGFAFILLQFLSANK